jgi:hypothetical protein
MWWRFPTQPISLRLDLALAKVRDDTRILVVDKDVGSLHVSVKDAFLMKVHHPLRDLVHKTEEIPLPPDLEASLLG